MVYYRISNVRGASLYVCEGIMIDWCYLLGEGYDLSGKCLSIAIEGTTLNNQPYQMDRYTNI